MKNVLKKSAALLLCLIMALSVTACHKVNETALTVGDVKFTSAFYSCALVFADLEGQQLVYDTLGSDAYDDYLNQTLDGLDYKTWVKSKAIERCKEMAAYEIKCKEVLLTCDEYISDYISNADTYWSYYYSSIMSENGVGRGTFRSYMSRDAYRDGYFDYIYGEGGEKEISNDDIITELTSRYVVSNIISADASSLSDTEKAELTAKFEAYAERIKNGEKFEKIYAEYNNIEYTENSEETGTFSYNYATVYGDADTDYSNDYYEDVKAMENGEIKIIEKTDDSDSENVKTTILFVYKNNISDESNPSFDNLKKIAMHSLKDEEFENEMQEFINSLTVEENTKATKRFKVEKIVYPTYN